MQARRSSVVWHLALGVMIALAASPGGAERREAAVRAGPPAQEGGEALTGQVQRLTLRPTMLADNIEQLAGRDVMIQNARVVGVFEPHAFLIEPATRWPEIVGHRDRVLVLIRDAALQVPADLLVASTVQVHGVARTLLGMRVAAEVPWPRQLDRERIERLDIRATVLATSVQTPEGIELTGPRSDTPSDRPMTK